ncbi:MAG: pantoate--beta-alanine ligase, partial [Gammaproteobacteria bacterium]|nr:pantoate--beta-alanine ligase [Gammaproteobacteria bacterium]
KQQGKRIAFVPTMGNLHQGHLELVRVAGDKADFVVASIFVNPMQFGQGEDFDQYPRTEKTDTQKLDAQGCDLLFLPSVETMYPKPLQQQTRVEVPGLSDILCGASRPGHFMGVTTIVNKLFNLVQPDVAVFGEKDFQQLMVIRRMVDELCMPIDIVGVAIMREADGLAMSSRNGYLEAEQRKLAPQLNSIMQGLAERIRAGETEYEAMEKATADQIDQAGFKTDYLVIRRVADLEEPQASDDIKVILAAAYLGSTRLIDNVVI